MYSNAHSVFPFDENYLQFLMDWQKAISDNMLQIQRLQWEMLAAWPRSFDAVQRELQDQWISHFGGGVPLDG